jgi:hypothetical protein
MRVIGSALAVVLSGALTACGGAVSTQGGSRAASSPSGVSTAATRPATPPPTGPNVSGCYDESAGTIFKQPGGLPGVIGGTGATGVVITYERRGNVCSWRPLFDRLTGAGYRVLVYVRSSGDFPEDTAVAMAKRLAKEPGVKRLFLVGGSIGATTAVPAAARLGAKVAGVVALSGEIDAKDAAGLTVPLLQIGSEHDGYGGAGDLNAASAAAVKAPDNEVLIIPGESRHASALFGTPHGVRILDRIEAFMARHKG